MNYNFNPEDLYKQKPLSDDSYYEDEIIRSGRQTVGRTYGKPDNSDIPSHIMQYHIQTKPQRSQIDLLENDVNNLLNSKLFNVKDSTNQVGDEHDDELPATISKDYNTSELIQNNIGEKKVIESLIDHHIIIDSNDRDITKYPNPFTYSVNFQDSGIGRLFEKVQTIRLDTAILPKRYYYLKQDATLKAEDMTLVANITDVSRNETFALTSEDASGNFAVIDVIDVDTGDNTNIRYITFANEAEYPIELDNVYEYAYSFNDSDVVITDPLYIHKYTLQTYSLHEHKYTLLNIKQLEYINEYSTNENIKKSFAFMFPDSKYGNEFCTCPKIKDKVHRFNNPRTLTAMDISIKKYDGTLLKNSYGDYIDYRIDRTKVCTCASDENGKFKRNYRCACTYFRHPYYHHFQNTLMFKLQAHEIGMDVMNF